MWGKYGVGQRDIADAAFHRGSVYFFPSRFSISLGYVVKSLAKPKKNLKKPQSGLKDFDLFWKLGGRAK